MSIEALLAKYFLDYADLKSNQQEYLAECFEVWHNCGLLNAVYRTHGGGDFAALENGASVTCSVRTGNVQIDRASFEREADAFYSWGPISTFTRPDATKEGANFNLSALVGLGFQIEFCLKEEVRKTVNQNYEENWRDAFVPQDLERKTSGFTSLSFSSASRGATVHHYWAEAVAAFSFGRTRDELQKLDPVIYKILNGLVEHPETRIASS
ncbi:MAG: hypothetical protein C0507_12510 [Cyanobacteria bacterium PR.3.49]|nr:hypothetical protein [Cyanobacteria bacterium PR.3.49]